MCYIDETANHVSLYNVYTIELWATFTLLGMKQSNLTLNKNNKVAKKTLYRSPEHQIDWPFCPGEEVQNRFPRTRPWRPSWISDRNDFSSFVIYKTPWCFLPTLEFICLSGVQEKKQKINFPAILDFWSECFLLFWPSRHLLIKFQDNRLFVSGEERIIAAILDYPSVQF